MPKAFLVRKQRILAAHAKEQAELAARRALTEGPGGSDEPLALVCPPVTPPASPEGQTGLPGLANHAYPAAPAPSVGAQEEPLSLTTKRRAHEESEDELVIGEYLCLRNDNLINLIAFTDFFFNNFPLDKQLHQLFSSAYRKGSVFPFPLMLDKPPFPVLKAFTTTKVSMILYASHVHIL